jgi:hypothetical protein
MPRPKLTRIERAAQRDYMQSFRADYPNASKKELRTVLNESTRILIAARDSKKKR